MASLNSTSNTMSEPPPYVYDMQQPTYQNKPTQVVASPQPVTSQFPQSFLFEKTSMSDLILCTIPDATKRNEELYYIATHHSWSSKPDVVIHCRPTPSSPALCTATFKTFSSTISLQCGDQATELIKDGVFTITHSFTTAISQQGKKERFEWRRSSGQEIAGLGARSTGMKLVRIMTGEVVAVYTGVRMSLSKKGKMAFLNSGAQGILGQNWELLAVVSLLAIVEKRRRSNNAAAGGAAGGGGC